MHTSKQAIPDRHLRRVTGNITVLQADGTPLPAQAITVAQKNHQFLFGGNGFAFVPLANGELTGTRLEQAEAYSRKFRALFNYATLPFYWGRFEPQPGQPDTARLKNTARWCVDQQLLVKGHPLCWHTLAPDWLLALDDAAILQQQLDRIRREMVDFKELINLWDVINEAVIMPIFNKYDNGLTRVCKAMGRINTIRAMFEAARSANPAATLLLNDFDISPAFDILVEGCLEAGVKIDAIGIQSHMHQGYWGVEKTLQVLERFERFGLPIHFTETTILSGHLMPPEYEDLNDYQVSDWPTTPEGEARQVEEVLLHYKTLFSHPLVAGITWWDFSDGQWLGAPCGLIRRDGSSKPVYDELLKLIKGEWWLAPTELLTDQQGRVSLSGFPGEYELSCRGNRLRFRLGDPDSGDLTLQLQ